MFLAHIEGNTPHMTLFRRDFEAFVEQSCIFVKLSLFPCALRQ